VQDERRTEEEIRRELAAERQQLADALTDLREGIAAKRKPAVLALAGLAAVLAVAVAVRVVRFARGGR
jgi:hypothetical protein